VAAPVRACVAEGGNTLWPPPPLLLSWTAAHDHEGPGRICPWPGSSAFCPPPPRNGAREKCSANEEKAGEKTLDRQNEAAWSAENEGLVGGV